MLNSQNIRDQLDKLVPFFSTVLDVANIQFSRLDVEELLGLTDSLLLIRGLQPKLFVYVLPLRKHHTYQYLLALVWKILNLLGQLEMGVIDAKMGSLRCRSGR